MKPRISVLAPALCGVLFAFAVAAPAATFDAAAYESCTEAVESRYESCKGAVESEYERCRGAAERKFGSCKESRDSDHELCLLHADTQYETAKAAVQRVTNEALHPPMMELAGYEWTRARERCLHDFSQSSCTKQVNRDRAACGERARGNRGQAACLKRANRDRAACRAGGRGSSARSG